MARRHADDLVFYAMQLGVPRYGRYLPLESAARHPGGEPNAIRAEPAAGAEGLFAVLTASAALLAAMVRVTPPDVRGHECVLEVFYTLEPPRSDVAIVNKTLEPAKIEEMVQTVRGSGYRFSALA